MCCDLVLWYGEIRNQRDDKKHFLFPSEEADKIYIQQPQFCLTSRQSQALRNLNWSGLGPGQDLDLDRTWTWTVLGPGQDLDLIRTWTWSGLGPDLDLTWT